MNSRLADFLRAELEPILQNWEEFAKTIFHAERLDKAGLRDHAAHMLIAIADDLDREQSDAEQAAKSKGRSPKSDTESWAEVHGRDRHSSGFTIMESISEFRALRASVVSLWTGSHPKIDETQLQDLIRFNEAIDQAVSESLERHAKVTEMEAQLLDAILLATPDPIYVLNLEGRLVYANKATVDLFELESEEIIGKTATNAGIPCSSDFQRNFKKLVEGHSIHRGKFVQTLASGQSRRFEYQLAPVLDQEKNFDAAVCISRDVTKQALAEERVWHSAHHDPLTGLPNRRLFMDRLTQEIKHSKRNDLLLAVLFMDLDHFKEVNDSIGHQAGDSLLSQVGQRLVDCVREDDTVARLSGDEFCAILVDAKQRDGVQLVAWKMIEALSTPFDVGEHRIHTSASVGIAFYPMDATSPLTLLENADKAMYRAKNSGANQVRVFDETDTDESLSA